MAKRTTAQQNRTRAVDDDAPVSPPSSGDATTQSSPDETTGTNQGPGKEYGKQPFDYYCGRCSTETDWVKVEAGKTLGPITYYRCPQCGERYKHARPSREFGQGILKQRSHAARENMKDVVKK